LDISRSFKVEIGGICAQINTETHYASGFLEPSLKAFFSSKESDFVLDVVKRRPSLKNNGNIYVDPQNAGLGRVRVIERDNKFIVQIEITSDSEISHFEAGEIDLQEKQCVCYDESEPLISLLLLPFFRSCLQFFLLKSGGFFLHSCGVKKDSKAYIFAGAGGAGKTTVGKLSHPFTVLSDDFLCIREERGRYLAYGTPWNGNDKDVSAEITKIFFLKQDKQTWFEELTPGEGATEILSNVFHYSLDRESMTDILQIVAGLTAKVPCYTMHFSLKDSLWDTIKKLEVN